MMASNVEEIESPCIGVCRMNASGHCDGCFRTVEEITLWWGMEDDERQAVMRRLEERQKSLISFD